MAMVTVHVDYVSPRGSRSETCLDRARKRLTFGSWNAMTDGVKVLIILSVISKNL